MANSEDPEKHFILNFETTDFCRRFNTISAEIGGCLCNSRWALAFYPNGHDNTDNYVWCHLVRRPGGPYYELKIQFKFQLIFYNSEKYETEYITHSFSNLFGRSMYKTSIATYMLTAYSYGGSKPMIFRCLIKDENSLDPDRQTWFDLA